MTLVILNTISVTQLENRKIYDWFCSNIKIVDVWKSASSTQTIISVRGLQHVALVLAVASCH